jgi:ribosomal protein L7Ae-like RNA K-turn-binding protein
MTGPDSHPAGPGRAGYVARLFEVVPLGAIPAPEVFGEHLAALGEDRVRLLPAADTAPWLVVHTRDLDAAELAALLPPGMRCVVTELRCRIELAEPKALAALVGGVRARGGLAVGRAAVERAAQRRRLDLVVLAADLDAAYRRALEKIFAVHGAGVQVTASEFSGAELGELAGARRAGCVGLLRGHSRLVLSDQAGRYRGRVVSSLPGSPSSAPQRLNGRPEP